MAEAVSKQLESTAMDDPAQIYVALIRKAAEGKTLTKPNLLELRAAAAELGRSGTMIDEDVAAYAQAIELREQFPDAPSSVAFVAEAKDDWLAAGQEVTRLTKELNEAREREQMLRAEHSRRTRIVSEGVKLRSKYKHVLGEFPDWQVT